MISPLKAGSKAPAFQAPVVGGSYEVGQKLKLSDLKGEHVVLYFYPKDDTPGCTKQACALRDGWQQISEKARVFGVSIDSVKSHEKFINATSSNQVYRLNLATGTKERTIADYFASPANTLSGCCRERELELTPRSYRKHNDCWTSSY